MGHLKYNVLQIRESHVQNVNDMRNMNDILNNLIR